MISLTDIQSAGKLLHGKVLRTPLVYSPTLSEMTGAEVYLKLENLQKGGSFKIRGATFKILFHLDEIEGKGVIAASVGNHAQGVALAARAASVPATIVMPVWATITKQQATRGYGAELILEGESLVESISVGQAIAVQSGKTFIHPYDDKEIITGQGTIGLEILDDLPDADYIIVPVGGGGLIAGIATAAKAIRPAICVLGVQSSGCPSAIEAMKAGRPVELNAEEKGSLTDAIMVTKVGDAAFSIMQRQVDEIVMVNEDQIASAILLLLERKRILAEGAGAAPLAALLGGALAIPKGSRVVLVISGGNVDSLILGRIIAKGLGQEGRMMRFSVCLEDVPGSLARLLSLIASLQANVVHIHHARNEGGLAINVTRVDLELETQGFGHIKEIGEAIKRAGYRLKMR
ncbi:MAG: threonine ammonia-lyase [Methanotrichaceae archaeon]|nr:threonine ammonia-lyase [Methanotrichaceae archaeon]